MKDFCLSYDTVYLRPRYSELVSRDKADTTMTFCGRQFKLPVVPANMQDVINFSIAEYLSNEGYFYIMHRFENATPAFIRYANEKKFKFISISVGVKEFAEEIQEAFDTGLRVDCVTIDVAHAHHSLVRYAVKFFKNAWPETTLIAGNVATAEGAKYLTGLGVDAIKVGIGDGKICTTKDETGFHIPTLQSLYDIQYAFGNGWPLIADGGARRYGDIAKALTFGATMVMSGGFFVGCTDSPAKINSNGDKIYRGSTSFEAKGHNRHVEGCAIPVTIKESYSETLENIRQALQSSISYGGGNDLTCFKNVEWHRAVPKI